MLINRNSFALREVASDVTIVSILGKEAPYGTTGETKPYIGIKSACKDATAVMQYCFVERCEEQEQELYFKGSSFITAILKSLALSENIMLTIEKKQVKIRAGKFQSAVPMITKEAAVSLYSVFDPKQSVQRQFSVKAESFVAALSRSAQIGIPSVSKAGCGMFLSPEEKQLYVFGMDNTMGINQKVAIDRFATSLEAEKAQEVTFALPKRTLDITKKFFGNTVGDLRVAVCNDSHMVMVAGGVTISTPLVSYKIAASTLRTLFKFMGDPIGAPQTQIVVSTEELSNAMSVLSGLGAIELSTRATDVRGKQGVYLSLEERKDTMAFRVSNSGDTYYDMPVLGFKVVEGSPMKKMFDITRVVAVLQCADAHFAVINLTDRITYIWYGIQLEDGTRKFLDCASVIAPIAEAKTGETKKREEKDKEIEEKYEGDEADREIEAKEVIPDVEIHAEPTASVPENTTEEPKEEEEDDDEAKVPVGKTTEDLPGIPSNLDLSGAEIGADFGEEDISDVEDEAVLPTLPPVADLGGEYEDE